MFGLHRRWKLLFAWVTVIAVIVAVWLWASSPNPDAKRARDAAQDAPASRSAIRPAALVDTPPANEGIVAEVGPRRGQLAPDFEASDLDGRRFRLSDYRGNPTIINFWASWCTACKKELPAIEAAAREHEIHGLRVVAVNMGDDPDAARNSLKARGVTLPVALDLDSVVAERYGVRGLPVSFFLDANGVIQRVQFGEMSEEMVSRFALEILDQRANAGASPEVVGTQSGSPPNQATLKVTLDAFGPGTLLLRTPILRCSAGFCSSAFIVPLMGTPGITQLDWWPPDAPDAGLAVTYDASQITPDDVIALYNKTLRESPDPLYPLPHRTEVVRADTTAAEQAVVRVTVGSDGPGTLLLESPSLRCSASFCAGGILKALREMAGVTSARSRLIDEATGKVGFVVSYDEASVTPDDVVATYQRAITENPDPLFPAPHRVEVTHAAE
jgi:thiol-disulfide isomerase/thioredoxin